MPVTSIEALEKYDVDNVLPSTELNAHLASFSHKPPTVYAIPEQVSAHVTFLGFKTVEFGVLKKAIEDSRVCKDTYEIALLRRANEISTLAHTAVVQQAKFAQNERELEATFIATCIANGCREQAYHSIVASGTNASTLHYVKNDQPLKGKLNILLDAGGEYNCYCADITRTFPISGSFTPESKEIYEIVLEMQESCFKMLKEGVTWEDVHVKAHKVAIAGLKKIGILKGSEEEILQKRISVAFFPHGLGHYLGMDTHDTGGNPNYADTDSMFRYLRVRYVPTNLWYIPVLISHRGKLPAGCVITVEPGIYFCKFLIEPYLENEEFGKYIDKALLDKYWDVGGVRIEDDVHVTKDGYENLTNTPKIYHDSSMEGVGIHGMGDM